MHGIQGGKYAGRIWYLLLKAIPEDYCFQQCPAEPALFVFHGGSSTLIVVTSTDDFFYVCNVMKTSSRPSNHTLRDLSQSQFEKVTVSNT